MAKPFTPRRQFPASRLLLYEGNSFCRRIGLIFIKRLHSHLNIACVPRIECASYIFCPFKNNLYQQELEDLYLSSNCDLYCLGNVDKPLNVSKL